MKNISLTLPRGKITAIVGASGSGKTTLVKLLLGFYKPDQGSIRIGNTILSQIPSEQWRESCGAVLQDGYIFSDTIANNISESDEVFNQEKFDNAVFVSNIRDYIDSLALKANTMIGSKAMASARDKSNGC
ncbi:MAG: ATP-binding cassette domain-containing protein [Pseudobacter sp.]|uniref:ATP-binding cassette domain-containing protein n=1 Tax=Pseudobacter sp. TaxID=2045420 RepID=UPI003F7E5093